MENWIYIVIMMIGFILLFNMISPDEQEHKEHMLVEYNDKINDNTNDIQLTVNTNRYEDPYYYNYGCQSNNCMRRKFWYGDTPFIWNNGTRYPKAPYYYIPMHNWYRDTYALPYYWFYGY